ncbi:MAG: FixH family protein [Gammaproteobacteria bacterium]|nr:MAG: FixH family protein [Gammaproteobacteria bacterium]
MMAVESKWYREPWVWFLVAVPLSSVVVGMVMLTLSVKTFDGLVEDDYYKRGKEINRVLKRDHQATLLGLKADIDWGDNTVIVKLSAAEKVSLPATLRFRMLHATHSGKDIDLELLRTPAGTYFAALPGVPVDGSWHVQLETEDWRLVDRMIWPGSKQITIQPSQN